MGGLDLQWLVRSLLYLGAAIAACVYALRYGGQPERLTAWAVLLASAATLALPRYPFIAVVRPLFLIDGLMLAGLMAIALCADRFWPMYFAAIHLLTVALHGVRAYDPLILPAVYARLGGELAYPTLAILVVGVWRHRRRRPDCDWTWQIPRST